MLREMVEKRVLGLRPQGSWWDEIGMEHERLGSTVGTFKIGHH